jgi:hypothetical protein
MTSQNVWNLSLFDYFFKVLSFFLEAKIRIRIKVKGRIRIRIKVTSRIRIQVRIKVMWIRNTAYRLNHNPYVTFRSFGRRAVVDFVVIFCCGSEIGSRYDGFSGSGSK